MIATCLIAVAALFGAAAGVQAGGWAVITLDELPAYFVAGQASRVSLSVRAHGQTLMDGVSVVFYAKSQGAPDVKIKARPTGKKGEYAAPLVLPKAGQWTLSIDTDYGFTGVGSDLPPLRAIAAGAPAPLPLSEIKQGEHLFVNKGCITCHVNREVQGKNLSNFGPELTGRKFPVDYLRKVLTDPDSALGSSKDVWKMPNLNLDTSEVAALMACINRDRSAVAGTVGKAQR
jgi:hypothetical protein